MGQLIRFQGGMMSKLMLVFGVLFLGVGVALGFLIEFQPGQMQVLALTPEVAALFLVGGALCLGLGNIEGALREGRAGGIIASETHTELAGSQPATPSFRGFGNQARKATATVVATEASVVTPEPQTSVAETISALEQAKSDIAAALGVETYSVEHVPAPPKPEAEKPVVVAAVAPVAPSVEAEATDEDNDLFVVEEKVIRGRPARILSDGTVEAETDEGWMRFENLEHLDEYLEAMVPDA
jgi:hypothetical protein